MLNSQALILVGSDEPHYTASKVFPYLLSQRPLMAIFHEESTVTKLLNTHQGAELITFSSQQPIHAKVEEILAKLRSIFASAKHGATPNSGPALEPYTTHAMAGRLANSFEKALLTKSNQGSQLWSVNAKGVIDNLR